MKPVVDRVYRLEDAAEAHAYVDTGRKRGSVVLTVTPVESETATRRRAEALANTPITSIGARGVLTALAI